MIDGSNEDVTVNVPGCGVSREGVRCKERLPERSFRYQGKVFVSTLSCGHN